jgi:hypothetical protein
MATAVLDGVRTIIATPPKQQVTSLNASYYVHQCQSLSCELISLMWQNAPGSCEPYSIRCPAHTAGTG